MISKNFLGLVGVIGDTAEKIARNILCNETIDSQDIFAYKNACFYVSKNTIFNYPQCTEVHDKSLLMSGCFFARDMSLDEFLDAPKDYLRKIIDEYPPDEIPLLFTNGAYIGIIRNKDTFSIFNDFFALQPLYYYQDNAHVIISTSLRLLNRFVKSELEPAALNEYLNFGNMLSYKTIRKGIKCLPPASKMCFSENGIIKIENYARYPEDSLDIDTLSNAADNVYNAFKSALKRIYSAKFRYCLNLTGGADTRLIYLEWPDRYNLLTETAGALDSSDVLKAKELAKQYGNSSLHLLEDMHEAQTLEGFRKSYELCDNPLNITLNLNYFHLQWKIDRGARIRLFGGGELLGGENLYLTRAPFNLLREMLLPLKYHKLHDADQIRIVENIFKSNYKHDLHTLLKKDLQSDYSSNDILKTYQKYLANPEYEETFAERLRTSILATAGYLSSIEVVGENYLLVSPYNDRSFIESLLKYHPKLRELRKLQFYILKKRHGYCPLPLDTTHLSIAKPYYLHKMLRVPRFVLNIGFHKRIPLLQNGKPPLERKDPYINPVNKDFRDYIKSAIYDSGIFDNKGLNSFFNNVESVKRFHFFTSHKEITNIYLLFRLACATMKT